MIKFSIQTLLVLFFTFLCLSSVAYQYSLGSKGLSVSALEADSPSKAGQTFWTPAYAGITSEFSNQLSISKGELNKEDQTKHSITIYLDSEGRLSRNKISKNQREFYPHFPYTEFGFGYSKNDNLNFFVNLTTEFNQNEWQMGVGEFSLSYDFEDVPLSVKAGWFPLPLGYMDQNSNVFSQDLSLHGALTQSQEDMSFVTDVHIWKEFLILQGSVFGGWSYRESDNSYKAPDSIPFIVNLKSRGFFWDAFISWFKTDLAFFEPLQALGAGIELKTEYEKLTVSIQSELWQVMEEGQTTFAYYVFPKLSIHKFQAGVVFGDINNFFPDYKTAKIKSSVYDRVFQLAYQVHPNVEFIGERFISKQRKGLLVNDSWAARVKVHFDWSKDF